MRRSRPSGKKRVTVGSADPGLGREIGDGQWSPLRNRACAPPPPPVARPATARAPTRWMRETMSMAGSSVSGRAVLRLGHVRSRVQMMKFNYSIARCTEVDQMIAD